MPTTVDLPRGAKATFRDSTSLKVRHRRIIEVAALSAANVIDRIPKEAVEGSPEKIEEAVESLDLSRADSTALMDLQDASIVAFLESWTLPEPLPTMDTVGDLDTDVYDALAAATKALGASAATKVDFSPKPLDVDSPTEPSSSSDGHLTASPETPPSTPTPLPDGESTATASSTPG